jgi:UDP-GlcNAc:undecaprenyl-phosphate GlcNAc-1-phosphate transferase
MREYGLTLLVAAAVTYLLTPLVRRFAIAVGALHAPRDRDVHTKPTPLLGGLAMYGGLVAGLLVAYRLKYLNSVFAGTRVASGLLLAGGLIMVIGFVDDRWGMGALSKLACQVAAGVILVWSGAFVSWLPAPSGNMYALDVNEQTAVTILVVVVTINAVNFLDGLDGLAAGVVGIGAAAFFLYYYELTKRLHLDAQTGPALVSALLVGVCLGFLPHNFHPARIFMGDTGAMLLGLLLAYAPISSLAQLDPSSLTSAAAYGGGTVNRFPEVLPLLLPAAVLLIPYADLVLAVIRRMRAGQSPFAADKKHLHHRLLDIGHSQRASVMIVYLWAALFSGTVVLLSILRTQLLVLAAVTVVAVLALLLVSMPGRLRPWARRARSSQAPARVITPVSFPAAQDQAARAPSSAPFPSTPAPSASARAMPDGSAAPAGSVPSASFPAAGPARGQVPPVSEW